MQALEIASKPATYKRLIQWITRQNRSESLLSGGVVMGNHKAPHTSTDFSLAAANDGGELDFLDRIDDELAQPKQNKWDFTDADSDASPLKTIPSEQTQFEQAKLAILKDLYSVYARYVSDKRELARFPARFPTLLHDNESYLREYHPLVTHIWSQLDEYGVQLMAAEQAMHAAPEHTERDLNTLQQASHDFDVMALRLSADWDWPAEIHTPVSE